MSQPFDPYLRWLGIRDPQRPPNHYRLLGIDLFESDADIIAGAADRQMAHIRSFQTGQHAELSQRILNELAAARVCLLKPEKKGDYDERLRAKVLPPQPRIPTAAPPRQPTQAVGTATARQLEASLPSSSLEDIFVPAPISPRSRVKRKPKSSLVPASLMVVALVGIAALGLFAFQKASAPVASNGVEKARPKDTSSKPTSPLPNQESSTSPRESSATTGVIEETLPQPNEHTPIVEEGVEPGIIRVEPDESVDPPLATTTAEGAQPETEFQLPITKEPEPESPVPPTTSDQGNPPALSDELPQIGPVLKNDGRLPLPSDEEQAAATQRIREVFGADLDKAKFGDAKAALAKTLYTQARESHDDRAAEFILLKLAEDFAIESGQVAIAQEIVGRRGERFAVNTIEEKTAALMRIQRQAKNAETRESLPPIAVQLIELAVAEENYVVAAKLSSYLLQVSTKSRDREAMKSAVARDKFIKESQKHQETARAALTQLPQRFDKIRWAAIFSDFFST